MRSSGIEHSSGPTTHVQTTRLPRETWSRQAVILRASRCLSVKWDSCLAYPKGSAQGRIRLHLCWLPAWDLHQAPGQAALASPTCSAALACVLYSASPQRTGWFPCPWPRVQEPVPFLSTPPRSELSPGFLCGGSICTVHHAVSQCCWWLFHSSQHKSRAFAVPPPVKLGTPAPQVTACALILQGECQPTSGESVGSCSLWLLSGLRVCDRQAVSQQGVPEVWEAVH